MYAYLIVILSICCCLATAQPVSPGLCRPQGNGVGVCEQSRLLEGRWVVTGKYDCNPIRSGKEMPCRCLNFGPNANCIITGDVKSCFCSPDNILIGLFRRDMWCCRGHENGTCPDTIVPRWVCCPNFQDKCLVELNLNGNVADISSKFSYENPLWDQRACEYATMAEAGANPNLCPINVSTDAWIKAANAATRASWNATTTSDAGSVAVSLLLIFSMIFATFIL